jgi:hypothetical protein
MLPPKRRLLNCYGSQIQCLWIMASARVAVHKILPTVVHLSVLTWALAYTLSMYSLHLISFHSHYHQIPVWHLWCWLTFTSPHNFHPEVQSSLFTAHHHIYNISITLLTYVPSL